MKRRYFTLEGDNRHSAEVELYDLIPESAIEEANAWLDMNHPDIKPWKEVKSREYIVRTHDRFEICVETHSEYQNYEFAYNPITREVKFIRYEGDFK